MIDLRAAFERGDGDTFGTVASTPLLFGLLAFGVTVAALGFGRVGALSAAERGAYAGGTRIEGPSIGVAVAESHFRRWSASGGVAGSASSGARTVLIRISRSAAFAGASIGLWDAQQAGAMSKRIERFYPGGGE